MFMVVTSGCNDEVGGVAREAANRQAQQNTEMAQLNKEVASGTRGLVEADAQARKEIIGVHHELQSERSRLDAGRDVLEEERHLIADQRRTESMFVTLAQLCGGILLLIVLLGFCWYVLIAGRRNDDSHVALNELLVCEFLSKESPRFSTTECRPNPLGLTQADS